MLDLTNPLHAKAYLCAARNFLSEIPSWPAEKIRDGLLEEEPPEELCIWQPHEDHDHATINEMIETLANDMIETFCTPPPKVRGIPYSPADKAKVHFVGTHDNKDPEMQFLPPYAKQVGAVKMDFWGRNPLMQALVFDCGSDEPSIQVRFNSLGLVHEILLNTDHPVNVVTPSQVTSWELERAANPPCNEGDTLHMTDRLTIKVARLQDRFHNDLQAFLRWDQMYRASGFAEGILPLLNRYPHEPIEDRRAVYDSLEQAWESNPLVVVPDDLDNMDKGEMKLLSTCPDLLPQT